MAIGFGLFLAGVMFSYFLVLPRALDFFLGVQCYNGCAEPMANR